MGFQGLRGLTLYARAQRTFGDYEDIASVTAPKPDPKFDGSILFNSRVPKSLDQVTLGLPLPFDRSTLNLSYTQLDSGCGDRYRIAGLSYTRGVFGDATMFASLFKDFEDNGNLGAFVGISVPLGDDITATSNAQYDSQRVSGGGDVMKSQGVEEGSYGWRIHDEEGDITDRSAAASYRASFAQLEGGVQQYGDNFRATGEIDGSIAFADNDVFFGNRIDDAFAIVDAGAPNVAVQYENRPVGETDSRGLILVPSLNSYQKNKITIDPKNLPVDADIPETKEIVVPADRSGLVVKFGVAESPNAALLTFVDEKEKPIDVGAQVHLGNSSDVFIVGYDGQAYLRGLAASNTVTIERPDGGSCHAEFAYTPQPGQQVAIQDVACR